MRRMENLTATLDRATRTTSEWVLLHLPQFLGALGLLLAGWLLARLLKMATLRGLRLLDALVLRKTASVRWQPGRAAGLVGEVVYWVVLLLFVTAATQTLGLQTFTAWLTQLIDYLPTLAAGVLIVAAGYVLSGVVAELVRATASGLAEPQRLALARLAQGATLILALLVGADQIGLKVTWIAIFAAVIAGSLLGGVTLAVSLGARGYVANLIGAHYLRQAFQPGQRVRVAGHEGHIVDLTATSLVLETDTGRVLLPGRIYHDEAIVIVARTEPE